MNHVALTSCDFVIDVLDTCDCPAHRFLSLVWSSACQSVHRGKRIELPSITRRLSVFCLKERAPASQAKVTRQLRTRNRYPHCCKHGRRSEAQCRQSRNAQVHREPTTQRRYRDCHKSYWRPVCSFNPSLSHAVQHITLDLHLPPVSASQTPSPQPLKEPFTPSTPPCDSSPSTPPRAPLPPRILPPSQATIA